LNVSIITYAFVVMERGPRCEESEDEALVDAEWRVLGWRERGARAQAQSVAQTKWLNMLCTVLNNMVGHKFYRAFDEAVLT
jgi:hypothetical protein